MSIDAYILNYKNSSNQLPDYVKNLTDEFILERNNSGYYDDDSIISIIVDTNNHKLVDVTYDYPESRIRMVEDVYDNLTIITSDENNEFAQNSLKLCDLYYNKLCNKNSDLLNDTNFDLSIKECSVLIKSFDDELYYEDFLPTDVRTSDEIYKRIVKCVDIAFSNFMSNKISVMTEESHCTYVDIHKIINSLQSIDGAINLIDYIDTRLYKLIVDTEHEYLKYVKNYVKNMGYSEECLARQFNLSRNNSDVSVLIVNEYLKGFVNKPSIGLLNDLTYLFLNDINDIYGPNSKEVLDKIIYPKKFKSKLTSLIIKNIFSSLKLTNLENVKNAFLDHIDWSKIPEHILHSKFPDGFETSDGSFKLDKIDKLNSFERAMVDTLFTNEYTVTSGFMAISTLDEDVFKKIVSMIGSNFYILFHANKYTHKSALVNSCVSIISTTQNVNNMKLFIETYCSIIDKLNSEKEYKLAVDILTTHKLLECLPLTELNIPINIKKYIMEKKLNKAK